MSALPHRFGRDGYVQQIAAFATLLVFNLVMPPIVGLANFGVFTVIAGAALTLNGTLGGGFDLTALRHGGGPGYWHPRLILQVLGTKLVLLTVASTLIATMHVGGSRLAMMDRTGMILAGAVLLTSALSSLLILIFTAAHRNDLAAILAMIQAVTYVGFPLVALRIGVSPVTALCVGIALSCALAVFAQCVLLSRLDPRPSSDDVPIVRTSLALGSVQWFDTVRSWGAFAVAAYTLRPAEIGSAKLAFSAAAAAAAMVPTHFPSLVVRAMASGSEPDEAKAEFEAVFLAGVALSIAVGPALYLLGVVLFPADVTSFLKVVPLVTVLAALLPLYRSLLAWAMRHLSPAAITGRLAMAAVVIFITPLALGASLQGVALILGICLGTVASIFLINAQLVTGIVRSRVCAVLGLVVAVETIAAATNTPAYLAVAGLVGGAIIAFRHGAMLRHAVTRLLA